MAAALWRIAWFPLLIALFAAAVQADVGRFVKEPAIDHLVDRPAELFDLQGKTVRFSPKADGSYLVETLAVSNLLSGGQMLEDAAAEGPWYSKGWGVKLPFLFPFAGKNWDHLYVNMNGNISFEKPESQYWPERNPWPDGGMCSVAAVLDARAAAGLEPMIAAFWGPYQNPSVSQVMIRTEPDGMLVTWNMTLRSVGASGSWRQYISSAFVPQRCGRVRVWSCRRARRHRRIVHRPAGQTKAPQPLAIPRKSAARRCRYRFGRCLRCGHRTGSCDHDEARLTAIERIRTHGIFGMVSPRWPGGPGGTRCLRSTLDELLVGRFSAHGGLADRPESRGLVCFQASRRRAHQCSIEWSASAEGVPGRWVNSGDDAPPFDLGTMDQGTVRFAAADEIHSGNIYEAFHYPLVTKTSERLLQSIYKQFPARRHCHCFHRFSNRRPLWPGWRRDRGELPNSRARTRKRNPALHQPDRLRPIADVHSNRLARIAPV